VSKCFNGTKINDSYNEPYIDMAVNKAVGQQEMPKDKDEALQQFLGEYNPSKVGAAKEVQSFSNLKNNSEIITYHATPSKTIENNKFEIRKPVHGGEGFPRGIHSAPQIKNLFVDLNSGEFGNNIFKLRTKVGTVFDLAKPDPALIKKLKDSVVEKYSGKVDQTQIEYMLGKINNR